MKTGAMTIEQAKDTGLAIILVCLLLIYFSGYDFLLLPAIAILLVTMTCPGIFKPVARVWFALSHLLGGVMSRVLLTVIFYVIVMPIGVLRRIAGADAMCMRSWKDGGLSVFKERNHAFVRKDIVKPY